MRLLFSFLFAGLALLCAGESRSALERDSKGWTDLTEAQGWTRVPIPATAPLNPDNQWGYDPAAKVLTCAGDKGHEMLRSDREYKDFVFHVEWRFKPLAPDAKYNSGVFVLSGSDGVYMVQAQVGPGPNVWLFSDHPGPDGKKTRTNLRDKMTAQRVKPAGEWNTYELTVRGRSVALWVNGDTIGALDPAYTDKGYIGLEAEGFPIEFRNVKIKSLR
jgi:hypothetical protein